MNRIERLLHIMGIVVLAALAALAGCSGGGGDSTPPPPPPKTSDIWVWTSGSDIQREAGVYGTKGFATVPGAREGATSLIDGSGNFWFFGGYGRDSSGAPGYLNDLWKFDGMSWTWMGGSAAANQKGIYGTQGASGPGYMPGGRLGAVSWIDANGNLWLFGGEGYDSVNGTPGLLNDLWMFDGTNGAWVSGYNTVDQPGVYGTMGDAGPSNVPGARKDAVSWIDGDGNLWLFGGEGYDSAGDKGRLNDLWKFDPGTSQWTWVSGSDIQGNIGDYGSKGVTSSSNVPQARHAAVSWTDGDGNFWLFGGYGIVGHLNDLWKFDGADWTWVSGASTINEPGVYGAKGVAHSDNVPSARAFSASWIDASGNLWLFGGYGYDSKVNLDPPEKLNDLWKFDPVTSQWTWVSGADTRKQIGDYGTKRAASPSNSPGARFDPVSWIDRNGNLWLFSGRGLDSTNTEGDLNDLWKFDGANWTWMSGSDVRNQPGVYGEQGRTNVPGAREKPVSWTDGDGNVWLFGGYGYDSAGSGIGGLLNDLWKFDGADWIWMSGSNIKDQTAVYGTKGTADPGNVPGARSGAVSWTDTSGNLWLFGGGGYDSSAQGKLNDLWKFDPVTSEWTWVSGDNVINKWSGMPKEPATPVPGARSGAVSWIDAAGNFWFFGGYGFGDNASLQGHLNDLWKFDGAIWTKVRGAFAVDQPGVYGTKGTADPGNVPGARTAAVSWIDASGNLWLFGGYGRDSYVGVNPTPTPGDLNDLWKFDGTNWTWVSGSDVKDPSGDYGTKGAAASSNVPGGRENAVAWTDASGNLWLFGGFGLDYLGTWESLNDLWKFDGTNWTWINGSDTHFQNGVYGTRGVADELNVPGTRKAAVSWTDGEGNFWLFGGYGNDSAGGVEELNDLWRYTP